MSFAALTVNEDDHFTSGFTGHLSFSVDLSFHHGRLSLCVVDRLISGSISHEGDIQREQIDREEAERVKVSGQEVVIQFVIAIRARHIPLSRLYGHTGGLHIAVLISQSTSRDDLFRRRINGTTCLNASSFPYVSPASTLYRLNTRRVAITHDGV